ncbi:MAG: hypothetical protein HN849_17130, partial [Victivallales bacterium]|nr:hypothetical protein [Victivallales bacterium]
IFGPILDPEAPMFRKPMFRRGERETNLGLDVQHNIVYWNKGVLTSENWERSDCIFDNNLYWNFGGHPVAFHERSFTAWQATGQDARSVIADPLFVDPAKGDYRLKDGSPASRIGFKPFDYSKAGRLTTTPAKPHPPAYPAGLRNPPRRDLHIELDFEAFPVGAPPLLDSHEEGQGTIRVTDATAATGKQSLRFTDAPGIKFFNPHLVMFSGRKSPAGAYRFSVDVMNDKKSPADIDIEFRDWSGKKILVGPQLIVRPDGRLLLGASEGGDADGTSLCQIPNGEWFNIDLRFSVTPEPGPQTFEITVRQNGQIRARKTNQPFLAPNFRTLTWGGIVSAGEENAAFYVDNLLFREETPVKAAIP